MDRVTPSAPGALRLAALAAAIAALVGHAAIALEEPPTTVAQFRRLSVEDSRACMEQGEEYLGTRYAAEHPEWTREILFRMARAALLVGDDARLEALAARLDALGRDSSDPAAAAYAGFTRAGVLADSGRIEEAMEIVTRAADSLDRTGDPSLRAVASVEVCDVAVRAGRPDLGGTHCDDALTRWRALGDYFQLGRAENYASVVARNKGDLDGAIAIGSQARADFLRAGMPALAAMMDDNLSGVYLEKGDAATALRLSQGSLRHELATGKIQHAALSRMNIAHALSLLGRHSEALETVAKAVEDAKSTGYDVALPGIYEVQRDAAERAGRMDLALAAAKAGNGVITHLAETQQQNAIAEMETRYRALEKQRSLERVEANLHRQRLTLALVGGGAASLALVAVLLVLLLRAGRQRERELAILSGTDALTGTASRRAFMQAIGSVYLAVRERGGEAAVWVIDADHFKRVNDEHGHPAGDAVLRELVRRVREHVRAADTLGRLGGEEFALVLPGASAADALRRAEAVREAIAAAPVREGGKEISITVSIGVAVLDVGRHETADRWLAAADEGVYAAKRAGRNRVELAG
jgi:diguanylate cyclase (GGDEF)-like protein